MRVGGRFRLVFGGPDGNEHEAAGVYKEVLPNRKLVFTWCWPRTTPDRDLAGHDPAARRRAAAPTWNSATSSSSTRRRATATSAAGRETFGKLEAFLRQA